MYVHHDSLITPNVADLLTFTKCRIYMHHLGLNYDELWKAIIGGHFRCIIHKPVQTPKPWKTRQNRWKHQKPSKIDDSQTQQPLNYGLLAVEKPPLPWIYIEALEPWNCCYLSWNNHYLLMIQCTHPVLWRFSSFRVVVVTRCKMCQIRSPISANCQIWA